MIIDADGKKHLTESDKYSPGPYGRSGKEEVFETQGGLKFRYDYDSNCFLTDDPDIYLHIYRDVIVHTQRCLFILHIHDRAIAFSEEAHELGFFEDYWRNVHEDGTHYWPVGGIGGLFRNPGKREDNKIALSNVTKFRSRKEQDFAIAFVTDALSRYTGSGSGLWKGKSQHADVIFSDEIQEKLANGALIESVE